MGMVVYSGGISNISPKRQKWSFYRQALCRYHLNNETNTCPFDYTLSISVVLVTANSVTIEGQTREFVLLPTVNALSDFEADSEWSTLSQGFDYAINNSTILLYKFILSEDICKSLVNGIRNCTTSIVLDGSFEPNSPIDKTCTLAVILAQSLI